MIYSATAPDGQTHRTPDRAGFKKLLRQLREQFPHGKTVIRVEIPDADEYHAPAMPATADGRAA